MADDLTVEAALKELHELFPKSWCYVEVNSTGDCNPRGRCEVECSAWIQIDSKKGDILYYETTNTLSEAMAQVRAWKDKQS